MKIRLVQASAIEDLIAQPSDRRRARTRCRFRNRVLQLGQAPPWAPQMGESWRSRAVSQSTLDLTA